MCGTYNPPDSITHARLYCPLLAGALGGGFPVPVPANCPPLCFVLKEEQNQIRPVLACLLAPRSMSPGSFRHHEIPLPHHNDGDFPRRLECEPYGAVPHRVPPLRSLEGRNVSVSLEVSIEAREMGYQSRPAMAAAVSPSGYVRPDAALTDAHPPSLSSKTVSRALP